MSRIMADEEQAHARAYLRDRVLKVHSQVDIAKLTNLTQPCISDLLKKNRNVTARIVLELSMLTGDSVNFILGLEGKSEGTPLYYVNGYMDAERTLRLHLLSNFEQEFWEGIRRTRFSKEFRMVTTESLYNIALAAAKGWEIAASKGGLSENG